MMDQGKKGHQVEGEPSAVDAAAAAGAGPLGKIEDMATREKRLKRELNKRAAKFSKGTPVSNIKKIADRKTKAHVRYAEVLADNAATNAALHEKWLLPSTPGVVEAEGPMEKTFRFQQRDIVQAVDINAARKAFDLRLPSLGPYSVDFTPNGRDLVIGGRKGHVAVIRWSDYKLQSEIQLRETVRDVQFLHSGQFFAVAQKKYAYIYDNRGTEIHCLKDHTEINKLDFLPNHFLLVSVGVQGVLRYQDTTHGKIAAQHRTKLGPCDALRHNPTNGVSVLGHANGTVTMWSPNMGTPLVRMLTHRGPVRSLAVDPTGRYVATAGADSQVKIFDLRTYKEVHGYFSAAPAVSVDISQRGMLSVCYGGRVQIWAADAIRGAKATAPYLNHSVSSGGKVREGRFCPYEDALGVGHSDGFSNLMVPGSGEPNYDSMVANPFETRNQRREQEVAQLMDKLAPETIQLDGDAVGVVRAVPKEAQKERREAAVAAELAARGAAREKNDAKSRMKGKNRISKRYRKKQHNVVDDKKMRARLAADEVKRKAKRTAEGAGNGPEGGGAATPGRTAGAASDAPVAPEGTSSALRRFYK